MNHRDRLTSHERLLVAVSFVLVPAGIALLVYVAVCVAVEPL